MGAVGTGVHDGARVDVGAKVSVGDEVWGAAVGVKVTVGCGSVG